jgi:DNA-binding NarL/FixJ family response regulator
MRVVIVADGQLAAEAVRGCLRSVPSFRVVGFIDGCRPVDDTLSLVGPDLVVLYATNAASASAKRIDEVRRVSTAKLVLLTRDMDAEWLRDACDRGVDAVVSVTVGTAGVGNLIRQIATGAVYHPLTPAAPAASNAIAPHADLTARELEILRLVASGASNSQVALELWVTEQTVKFHLSNTYRKLEVANRTEAAHYAHTHGLLTPERPTTPARTAVAA